MAMLVWLTLRVILSEKFVTCLLLYVPCLNRQKKHQILQEMLQNQIEEQIDVRKYLQTMLKLCLIIRCE